MADIIGLLEEMHERFATMRTRWAAIVTAIASRDIAVAALLDDLSHAIAMTSLRATQVLEVYRAADSLGPQRAAHLGLARTAIERAEGIVRAREQRYRVSSARIAGWRWTPTAYHFGYLWTTHSLLYWWRDLGIVNATSPESRSPCYLNYQSPIDVAMGEGLLQDIAQRVRDKNEDSFPAALLTDCLAAPEEELRFPQDL